MPNHYVVVWIDATKSYFSGFHLWNSQPWYLHLEHIMQYNLMKIFKGCSNLLPQKILTDFHVKAQHTKARRGVFYILPADVDPLVKPQPFICSSFLQLKEFSMLSYCCDGQYVCSPVFCQMLMEFLLSERGPVLSLWCHNPASLPPASKETTTKKAHQSPQKTD